MGQLKTKNDNKPEQVATKNFSQVFDFIDIICYHLLPIKRLKRFAKPLYGESCIVGSNPIPSASFQRFFTPHFLLKNAEDDRGVRWLQ